MLTEAEAATQATCLQPAFEFKRQADGIVTSGSSIVHVAFVSGRLSPVLSSRRNIGMRAHSALRFYSPIIFLALLVGFVSVQPEQTASIGSASVWRFRRQRTS